MTPSGGSKKKQKRIFSKKFARFLDFWFNLKDFFRKICGRFQENLFKFSGKSVQISGKFGEIFRKLFSGKKFFPRKLTPPLPVPAPAPSSLILTVNGHQYQWYLLSRGINTNDIYHHWASIPMVFSINGHQYQWYSYQWASIPMVFIPIGSEYGSEYSSRNDKRKPFRVGR